jgi:hypothetical protein
MKLENQSGDNCEIGFNKSEQWYGWVGYRMYKIIRRVNDKPVKLLNQFYSSDSDRFIGFELDERDKRFYI